MWEIVVCFIVLSMLNVYIAPFLCFLYHVEFEANLRGPVPAQCISLGFFSGQSRGHLRGP